MAENPKTIPELARALNFSEKALNHRRRMIRMENPDNIEARLLAWLRAGWEEHRDKVRRCGKSGGESEFWSGSMGASTRHLKGTLHQEPERVTEPVEDEYSRVAWETFGVLKGEELAKRETRSRAERLRQAEFELRQKGKSHERYAETIEEAIAAMRAEARAA